MKYEKTKHMEILGSKWSDWNTDYYLIHSSPDDKGRSSFTMYWMTNSTGYSRDEVGLTGQCFFANIDEYIERSKARGVKVVMHKERWKNDIHDI